MFVFNHLLPLLHFRRIYSRYSETAVFTAEF